MTVAEILAEFVTGVRYEDLPDQAIDHAAMLIASTLASGALGTQIESAQIIRDLEVARGGAGEATVWYTGGQKLPMASAARVNGMFSDAAASDDSDLRNISHPGTTLAAVALAAGEQAGRTGKDILAAMVAGYEVAGRIGYAVSPVLNAHGHHGCKSAVFGGTIAAARLLGLDAVQTANAIVLTATSIGGIYIAAATSVAREYHAGLASMLSIEAVQAAKNGYTCELKVMEAPRGYFDLYGHTDGAGVVDNLPGAGSLDWDIITDMALKLVPGGHPSHSLAEAAANAAIQGDIKPEEISAIIVSRPGLTEMKGPRHPENLVDMAHSPFYFVAAGAADRTFGFQHASPEKIPDPVIHSLTDLVQVGPEPTVDRDKYRQGATVTIETKDGRRETNTVFVPRGAGCNGIDWADVDTKYHTLMPNSGLAAAKIDGSLEVIRNFKDAPNAGALTAYLA